jgi:hypothetical protein
MAFFVSWSLSGWFFVRRCRSQSAIDRDLLTSAAILPVQRISHLSPVKWGILALKGAIWRGFTLGEMFIPCAILLAVGVICFGAGVTILSRSEA